MYKTLILLPMLMGYTLAHCSLLLGSEMLPEYQISDGVFQTLDRQGLAACQRACLERSRCTSIGYNRVTMNCFLGKYTGNKVFTGKRADVYVEPNWNTTLPESLGPCRSRQCSKTEQCVPLWNGTHACITELKPVDLTVLLDVTKSINATDFQSMVDCVQRLLGQLYDVRLAVVYFSRQTQVQFRLNEFVNRTAQIQALQRLNLTNSEGNRLAHALFDVHSIVYNGSVGDRPDAGDVILIMLHANDMKQNNLTEVAASVKTAGIHIITVDKNPYGSESKMIADRIASEPLEENILTISTSEDWLGMETQIAESIRLGL